MKKNKFDPMCLTCLIFFAIPIVVIFIYEAVEFFKAPDLMYRVSEFFAGVIIYIGLVLLFFVSVRIYGVLWAIKDSKISRDSKDYPVRCHILKMQKYESIGSTPKDLPEEPAQDTNTPIYFNITMTNCGICITTRLKARKAENMIADHGLPLDLFRRNWSNPVIIPTGFIDNLAYELAPANSQGHTNELSKISGQDQREIVILFRLYIQKTNLQWTTKSLDHPLKLRIIVLNETGDHDAPATDELYKTIYERMHPIISNDDDDSWMYRSRPIVW